MANQAPARHPLSPLPTRFDLVNFYVGGDGINRTQENADLQRPPIWPPDEASLDGHGLAWLDIRLVRRHTPWTQGNNQRLKPFKVFNRFDSLNTEMVKLQAS